MTLDLHDIELHDASLHSIATDHRARTVKILLEYYRESDSRARVTAAIKFLGVVRMQEAADLDELADNARAGNVVQWVPSRGGGHDLSASGARIHRHYRRTRGVRRNSVVSGDGETRQDAS